jgi:tight adherence protein C
VYALCLGLGFLAPDFWLGRRISTRQKRIRRGLPDVLDLLVICIEAGLSLDQATARTARELKEAQPEAVRRIEYCGAGATRRPPSRRCLETPGGPHGCRLCAQSRLHAGSGGSSLEPASPRPLRIHSDTLRTQRVQAVEEAAAKTTIKLIFPLVFFIFPSLFLVVLGPAFISIMESFKGINH